MHEEVYHQYARVLNDHWWTQNRRHLARWALGRAGVKQGQGLRILELGSGVGVEHDFLSQYGTVTGVELSEVGLGYCEERSYHRLISADLNDFRPEPASYDLIVDFHVLYHQWIASPEKVLARLRSGLAPGGVFLATEPGFEILRRGHDRSVMGGRRFSVRKLRQLMSNAGFVVEQASAFTSLLSPVLLGLASYERLRPHAEAEPEVGELAPSPRPVQLGLRAIMALERQMIKAAPMPFGGSVLAVGRAA